MFLCPPPPGLTPSTFLHCQLSTLIYILSPPTNGIIHKFPEEMLHTQTHRPIDTCVHMQDILDVMSLLEKGCKGQSEDMNISSLSKMTLLPIDDYQII